MQTPLFVRPLTADERATLETGLRSSSAFTVRRCQMLLASAERQPTTTIARSLHCTDQTVRNTIACIPPAWSHRAAAPLVTTAHRRRPSSTLAPARPSGRCCTRVRGPSASPQAGGRSQLAAEVSFAQGLTPRLVSDETIRVALRRLRVSWKRAKHWITSPDPAYARKKNGATS